MTVKKTQELRANVPAHLCYEMLSMIGSELDWKVLEENVNSLSLKWSQGGGFSIKVIISTILKPLGSQQTLISLTGELPGLGLVDGPGHIPKAFGKILVPFERMAIDAERLLRDGLMCPTCGKQLPPGTRFCPNDGTPITLECAKCGHNNIPSAQFCASCGTRL